MNNKKIERKKTQKISVIRINPMMPRKYTIEERKRIREKEYKLLKLMNE